MTFGLREQEVQIKFPNLGNGNASGKYYSHFSGTGMRVENSFPNFWERECEWKIPNFIPNFREREFPGKFGFQFLGTEMRVEYSIPNFREGECE